MAPRLAWAPPRVIFSLVETHARMSLHGSRENVGKLEDEVETDLQKVIRKLDKLTADVEELKNDQPRTLQTGKFNFAPTHVGEEEDVLSSMLGPARGRQQGACQNRAPDLLSSDPEGELQDSEVQAAYQNIVDSVQKFRLPASLKCNIGQPKGIKREDHLCVNILRKCGAFSETIIKLLSNLSPDQVTEADMKDLFTIALAQLRYVQEKYTFLTLQSSFGKKVATLYENIEQHPSAYRPRNLESVRAAVSLVAAEQQNHPPQSQPSRGHFHQYRPQPSRDFGYQPRFGSRRGPFGYDPYRFEQRVPAYRGPRPHAPSQHAHYNNDQNNDN